MRRFHPPVARFDGIIGGPPCQAFSRLRHLVEHNGFKVAANLIPEFERCVAEAQPAWFVMENVPEAPMPDVPGYTLQHRLMNNRWLGEEQRRIRRFTFGALADTAGRFDPSEDAVALLNPVYSPAVCASGATWQPVRLGGSGKPKKRKGGVYGDKSTRYLQEAIRLQGLPADWDLPGFTVREKLRAVGNGVPVPMSRAVARAVRRALGLPIVSGEVAA